MHQNQLLFLIFVTVAWAANDGRYYRDDSGKYVPFGDEGRYYPDLSGKYIHDGKGGYIYDGSGLYSGYFFGKNGIDFNSLAHCPPPILRKYSKGDDKWEALQIVGPADGSIVVKNGGEDDTENRINGENITESLPRLGTFKYIGPNDTLYEISYFTGTENGYLPPPEQNHIPATRSTKKVRGGGGGPAPTNRNRKYL